jgi:hypothetical protein
MDTRVKPAYDDAINASLILFTKIASYPAAVSSGLPADVV